MEPYMDAWDAGMREAWVQGLQGMADVIGSATLIALALLLPMALLLSSRRHRKRLVCPWKGEVMHVEFDACGFPGLPWAPMIHRCSAFDPPTSVACDGACMRGTVGRGAGLRDEHALAQRREAARHARKAATVATARSIPSDAGSTVTP